MCYKQGHETAPDESFQDAARPFFSRNIGETPNKEVATLKSVPHKCLGVFQNSRSHLMSMSGKPGAFQKESS